MSCLELTGARRFRIKETSSGWERLAAAAAAAAALLHSSSACAQREEMLLLLTAARKSHSKLTASSDIDSAAAAAHSKRQPTYDMSTCVAINYYHQSKKMGDSSSTKFVDCYGYFFLLQFYSGHLLANLNVFLSRPGSHSNNKNHTHAGYS